MQIFGDFYYTRLTPRIEANRSAPVTPVSALDAQSQADRDARADALGRASKLGSALSALTDTLEGIRPRRARAASTASAFRLDLGSGPLTATTLRSSEEVNATPTSFTPFGPEYIGNADSTAVATIGGVYDGSNGSGTIEFEARDNGVHGEDNLRFRVRDPQGDVLETIRVQANDPIDQIYTLSNGLTFQLSEGFTDRRDKFTIEVFDAVGSVVDPNKAMNGVRNDNPNLEYGLSVTDGAFDVNGVSIAVNAGDSINDVLARITNSAAGVTATFDVATEQVLLTQNTPGGAYDIVLDNDTSGFLAATKLDDAVAELGNDGGVSSPIGELAQFAQVTSNSLQVNGNAVAVDILTDSLEDILERIEQNVPGVTATLSNDRVYLRATDPTSTLELDDGGTGLLAAIGVREGTHDPVAGGHVSASDARIVKDRVDAAGRALDDFFAPRVGGAALPGEFQALQDTVRAALARVEQDLANGEVPSFGVRIDVDALGARPATTVDVAQFDRNVRLNFDDLRATFLADDVDGRRGFVSEVLDLVDSFAANFSVNAVTRGGFLDITV